jgi:HlyD family secretion protein/epimerase transport system membrane fusion protein
VVVVESHRKTIQHLEGGIVRDIFVTDGQVVKAGQLLLRMDATEARASLSLLSGQADALTAQQARLEAERDGDDHITFPPELLARQDDPKVAEAIRGEVKTFESRRDTLRKQVEILNQRISENGSIIAGLQKQQVAVEQQSALIDQETSSVQGLYQKGLSTLPRLLQLQRQAADLGGQRGQIVEKIGQVTLNSGEDQLQIVSLKNQFLSDLMKDLRDAQTKRFDTLDRLHAAKDVVMRTDLTAPVSGKVVALAVHTRGAVIRPGDTVMEIVPTNDELSVEAHVRPEDADDVHIGMTARVNLGAYKQRRLPMISGIVTGVSADRLTDQRTGQPYFNVLVSVDRSQLKNYPDIRFIPGMPVDVNIDTGNRTMLDYFLEPITGVFNRGMRER